MEEDTRGEPNLEQNKRADLEAPSTVIYRLSWRKIRKLHDVPAPLVRCDLWELTTRSVARGDDARHPPQGCYQVVTLHNRPKGSSTGLTLLESP